MLDRLIRLTPVVLFIIYSAKLLVFNAGYAESLVLGIIALLYYGCVYKFDEKKFNQINKEIETLHKKIDSKHLEYSEQISKYEKEFVDVRNYINASKAVSGLAKNLPPAKQW